MLDPIETTNKRIHLLDFIRLFVYLAIVSFHFQDIVWFDQGYFFANSSLIWHLTEQYARTFSYGGQIILLLTFFLIGFNNNTQTKLRNIIIGSFVASLLMDIANYTKNGAYFIWDIYPLIFVGTCLIYLVLKINKNLIPALGLLGLILINIKFWQFETNLNLNYKLQIALFGDCNTQFADWPIFPWIGLIWLSYAIGNWGYNNIGLIRKPLSKFEYVIWAILLIYSLLFFNSYRQVPTDDGWACFVFRQEPYKIISQLLLYIFLIRIAFISSINQFLARRSITQLLTRLELSKNFGIFYLTHYLTMVLTFYLLKNNFVNSAEISFVVMLSTLVLTEALIKSIRYLIKK